MIVRVDFFKETGKWYAGGDVAVGEARLWRGDMAQEISQNQEIVLNPEEFFTVISPCNATPDNEFVRCHYKPGQITRRKP